MVYLWEDPKNCTNSLIAEYDRERSPDRFLFMDGKYCDPALIDRKLIFHHSMPCAKIQGYDCIPNNCGSPLVNQRVADILLAYAAKDVQFFDAEVHCKDGKLDGYKLLNVISMVKGLDLEKSIYTTFNEGADILGFTKAVYKPNCMAGYGIARDKEHFPHILVNDAIKTSILKSKIKGVWFPTPEEFYSMLYGPR